MNIAGPSHVVVDSAAGEWIPLVSGVPQGSALDPILLILYTSEMFDLVKNRIFSYADDSTLRSILRDLLLLPP